LTAAIFSSIIVIVCAVSSIVFFSIGYACGRFGLKHKQSRTSKAIPDSSAEETTCHSEGSQLPQTPGPLYEELLKSTPEHQDLVELKENVAYGPIVKTS
jgi:nitrous oxide reductase accessory protein NosL